MVEKYINNIKAFLDDKQIKNYKFNKQEAYEMYDYYISNSLEFDDYLNYGCFNCTDCIMCFKCKNCQNCCECIECIECNKCINCIESEKSIKCKNCRYNPYMDDDFIKFNYRNECDNVRLFDYYLHSEETDKNGVFNCYKCKNSIQLNNCVKCNKCMDCNNLKYSYKCYGLNNNEFKVYWCYGFTDEKLKKLEKIRENRKVLCISYSIEGGTYESIVDNLRDYEYFRCHKLSNQKMITNSGDLHPESTTFYLIDFDCNPINGKYKFNDNDKFIKVGEEFFDSELPEYNIKHLTYKDIQKEFDKLFYGTSQFNQIFGN